MVFDLERQRRPTRLREYDYSTPGLYFVTICAQDRACLFGEIVNGEMRQTTAGLVIESWWCSLSWRYPGIGIDKYVVMPNHLHGILWLGLDASELTDRASQGPIVGEDLRVLPPANTPPDNEHPSLSHVIQWFKSITTRDYSRGVDTDGWPPFRKRLWQRTFHDHIIRDTRGLDRIRSYIDANPANWLDDPEHPS